MSNRFDVDVEFLKIEDGCAGQADVFEGVVELDKYAVSLTEDYFLSTLLHEAAHVWAYRNGVFLTFHELGVAEHMTVKELEVYIATAWRAERWVEKKAQSWMAEFYPGHLYWFSYGRLPGRERSKKWFDEVFLGECKKELRKRKLRAIDRKMKKSA